MLYTFECAFKSTQSHYCSEAIQLSCGHYVCTMCVSSAKARLNCIEFGCKHCGKILNFAKFMESTITNGIIRSSINPQLLNDIFIKVYNQYNESINKLKQTESSFNHRIEYLFDEVDLRVESLKHELDILADCVKNELQLVKDTYSSKLNEKYNETDIDLVELQRILEGKCEFTAYHLKNYQEKMSQMAELVENLNSDSSFQISNEKLDLSIVASRFSFNTPETLSTPHEPTIYERFIKSSKKSFQICPLDDKRILFLTTDGSIKICDKNFKLLQATNQINKLSFHFDSVAANGVDRIYFIGCRTPYITMTDYSLNFIKTFDLVSPNDITFFNNHVYACDGSGVVSNIVKLTMDLKIVASFNINEIPNQIKILNNIACILTTHSVHFYDITDHSNAKLLYRYNDFCRFRCLYTMNNQFYLSTQDESMGKQVFYLFSNSGDVFKRVLVETSFYGKIFSFLQFGGKVYNNFYDSSSYDNDSTDMEF